MKILNANLRIIVFLTLISLIVGCQTIQFTSDELVKLPPKKIVPHIKNVVNVHKKDIPVYKHGRFMVEVYPDKDIIYGGVFKPELPMPYESMRKHVIFINYQTKELSYFRFNGSAYESVIGYAVMAPLPDFLPKNVVRGSVIRIDTKPSWCPTSNIRRRYPYLPEGCLPFGHELNAMGIAKFEIRWNVPNWDAIRLHGTGGYAEGNFWDEETFGCTRLKNELMLGLLGELGDSRKAVEEGIEIIAYR